MNSNEMMRAAWFDDFGSAQMVLKLGNFLKPSAGPGEVLVKLYSSGVNPSDVKKRAGSFPDLLDAGPVIPNSDGAGIIEAVGAGVPESRLGERVWVYQAQFARQHGTAAEYVAIDSSRAIILPDNTGFDVGACIGIPMMTAHRCVFADGEVAGKSVLVTGGAGRVGHYAIQWASQAGANVIASASNDVDIAACKDAGASKVVNHRDNQFATAVLDANKGMPLDRVIDVEFGANLDTSINVCRVGGTIATYSSAAAPNPKIPFYQMMYKDLVLRFVIVYAMPESAKEAAIKDIQTALEKNLLQHRISNSVPLKDIVEANELIETGKIRGCVVLKIN